MTSADAKREVLGRIRAALGPDPQVPDVPRAYRTTGAAAPGAASLVDLLADRLEDYRAVVVRTTHDSIAAAVAQAVASGTASGAGRNRPTVVAPPGLPGEWLSDDLDVVRDDGLSSQELDDVDAVVTGAAVAIAETGTLVLDGSADQGRRAITLVPDLHVCVVSADLVVASVPEALARLDPRRPQTWISGPSATSDIELERVEGVHGPRRLHVVVVES